MQALQETARKLLADGTVKLVIGYEEGPRGARPVFITDPAQCSKLIFDHRCVQNLATYLSPRRSHLVTLGKTAVVVKGCDARAIGGLVRETQIKRENVVVIGVRCGGVVKDPASKDKLTADTVADRCPGCTVREPTRCDHLVGDLPAAPPGKATRDEKVAALDAKSADDRFGFWTEELSRCIRCHACREVCPMCFCEQCVADKSEPQWIETSPHTRANLAWQTIRVLHLAGRCVDCGECERACPADIPLGLIVRKVQNVVEDRFGHRPTDDPAVPSPIGTFKTDDRQEFIL